MVNIFCPSIVAGAIDNTINYHQNINNLKIMKAPHEYPNGDSMPHLQVAKRMLSQGKPVNVGDHIPYVICKEGDSDENKIESSAKSVARRAKHPQDIKDAEEQGKKVEVDIEWYASEFILTLFVNFFLLIFHVACIMQSKTAGIFQCKYCLLLGAFVNQLNLPLWPILLVHLDLTGQNMKLGILH